MNREHIGTKPRRRSVSIRGRPAINIHHATRFAENHGVPLNVFVTVNFTALGVPIDDAVPIFLKVLAQRFAPWLRRSIAEPKLQPTYVWSMENAGGQLATHWLVHLPAQLVHEFRTRLTAWLTKMLGEQPPDRAIDIRPIYNIVGARRYILKGTDPSWAGHLGVVHVPQGEVIGKRSGLSRNLGPVARKRQGYRPRRYFSPSPASPAR